MRKISAVLSTFLLIFCFTSAVSALTLSNVDGDWGTVTGGASVNYSTGSVSYGNGSEDRVLWGGPGRKSGLGFTGFAPPFRTFNVGDTFEIGQLRHLNNPTSGDAATAVDLKISLSFSDPLLYPSYLFDFEINETPNNEGDNNDYIFFPTSYASQSYEVGGSAYTLQLLGFGSSADNLDSRIATPEYGLSSTKLYGRITTAPVPEPATILLLGFGISGLVGIGRKKFFKN